MGSMETPFRHDMQKTTSSQQVREEMLKVLLVLGDLLLASVPSF